MIRVVRRLLGGVCLLVLILPFTSAIVFAQAGATAQISGLVRDTSGGVLPGADVIATQTDTGFKRNVLTDATGTYTIPSLPIGPYRVEVNLQGFKTYTRTGVVLQVNDTAVINIELSLGAVEETVLVQAESPLIETRNMGVGQVMDNKRILELPLNGRNPADLVQYLPAVVPQPQLNATSRSFGGTQGGLAFAIAGGQSYGVAYLLDGATHNNPYDNLNLPLPFPDALQEFKVETSALTAQNGMHSGAAVNAVTKSGTNTIHGDVFEFLRHHSVNATNPFNAKNPDGTRKDDGLKRNQYGGTVGGPIRTDRIFYFGGYQGTNTRQLPSDNRAFVPTAAMLTGDFTAFASPACNAGRQIALASPFSGNRVDPALFSRAALAVAARLPKADDACGLVQYTLPTNTDETQYVGKVDYQVGSKQSYFGRYISTSFFQLPPYETSGGNLLTTRQGGRDNLAQSVTGGHNYVLSSTTVNSFRAAFNRTSIHRTNSDFFGAADVGINLYDYMPQYLLLNVTPNGFQIGGGTENEARFRTNTYQFSDDLTLIRGTHQFVVGGNWAHWNSFSTANVRSPGQLTVGNTATGLALGDFLLGRLSGTIGLQQSAPNFLIMKQTYVGIYAQDTWRASSNLTVNYGLRWEPFFPQQITNNAVYNFDFTRFQQGVKSSVYKNAPAGLHYPGDPDFPTQAGQHKVWSNLGPRVGVAWDPTGSTKTSVRASYGRSFDFVNAQFHLNTSNAPPWGDEIRIVNPPGGLDNPFQGSGQTNIFPTPTASPDVPFTLFGPYLSLNYDMTTPYVDLWNVTVERQLSTNWVVSAGYVGSHTSNILESTPLNNPSPSVTVARDLAGNVIATCNPTAANFQTCMTANQNQRRPFYLANPAQGQYFGNVDAYVTNGSQRYNGMLLSIARRAGRGTSVSANYTLSHCYGSPDGFGGATANLASGYNDPNNPQFDEGNCTSDRRHVFVLTAGVESPRFEGSSPALRAAASGWRLVGSFRALTGPYLNIVPGSDRALNSQAGTQRVNQALGDPYGDNSFNAANGGRIFLNPAAFAQPALGTLGTLQRNSIEGIGYKNVDMSLSRLFRLTTSRTIEVRVEAFNAFNWFGWGAPSATLQGQPSQTLSGATFGQITSAGDPRFLQFGIKFGF
jgi:carboxypeptidase family protein